MAQDGDGKALIAYSSERNRVMHVARLTKNFTDVDIAYARTMVSPFHCHSANSEEEAFKGLVVKTAAHAQSYKAFLPIYA